MDELREDDERGLRDYLAALRRRWRTAAIGFVVGLLKGLDIRYLILLLTHFNGRFFRSFSSLRFFSGYYLFRLI